MRFTKTLVAVLALACVITGSALALAFDDQSYIWPNGKVGVPYAKQLGTRSDCPPFTYSIIGGSLPPGIGLSLSGLASGTPTKAGTFSFWVALHDCLNMSSEREFSVVIEDGSTVAPVDVTTSALRSPSSGRAIPPRSTRRAEAPRLGRPAACRQGWRSAATRSPARRRRLVTSTSR